MKEQLYVRLKKIREEKGFSQAEVAQYINISRQAISNWENGKSLPDIDNIILLSELYGITVDELLIENSNKKDKTIKNSEKKESESNNISNTEVFDKKLLEIIGLSILLFLSAQFPFIGVVVVLVIAIGMKYTKRNYKLVYCLCVVCLFLSLYTTYIMVDHLFFDMGTYNVNEVVNCFSPPYLRVTTNSLLTIFAITPVS